MSENAVLIEVALAAGQLRPIARDDQKLAVWLKGIRGCLADAESDQCSTRTRFFASSKRFSKLH